MKAHFQKTKTYQFLGSPFENVYCWKICFRKRITNSNNVQIHFIFTYFNMFCQILMTAHRILVIVKDRTDAPIESMGTAVSACLDGLEHIVKIVSII